MVAEACQWAATQGVDFSKYDWDGDGEVDQVFVLYAGKGEADGGAVSTVWPHEFALSYSDYGKSLSLSVVTVDTYACSAELNGRGKLDGIGTFCHEFSHCMGFPDFYDTSYSGWFGMGAYDLMCAGNYNGDGKCPAGYSAYEKHECGWITYQDVTHIDEALNVTGLKAISEGGSAYVLKNKAHEDEYYIIENRQNTGWDAYLPSEGVMITHVDYDAYIWWNNMPNTKGNYYDEHKNVYYNDHQRLTIFRAGRSTSDDGVTSDLYPYNTNNSLTAESNPAATLYNKNSDGTKYMHVDITDISVASDGTASLTFSKADRSSGSGGETDPDTPVTPSGSVLLYESFDKCGGTGGNDNQWSGNGVAGSEALSMEFDNNGWTSSNKIFSGNQCVRLGNSSTAGVITTPAFSVNGSAYLSFKAGGWDGTNDATSLTLSVNNGTLSKTSVRIPKGSWNQFGVTITATGTVKVTFKADKKRFFLDEVKVVDPTIDSGIHDIVTGEENGGLLLAQWNPPRWSSPRSLHRTLCQWRST
jgi:immune inhibitor A